ncbi:MAG TPA: hypothetical protein VLE51_00470 [Candidatus Saccharimonadales bacterium]|nr:hypothetical protein [Candidatus Saccharimonadales bacterium]
MDNKGGPSFELPIDHEESHESQVDQQQEQVIEKQRPAVQETGVGKRAPKPGSTAATDVTAAPLAPAAPATPTDKPAPAAPTPPATSDLQAADADLIEKEWIVRAKSIVAKTSDDPHKQKSEMSKAKADYIKKRYNKTIKTDDTVAA